MAAEGEQQKDSSRRIAAEGWNAPSDIPTSLVFTTDPNIQRAGCRHNDPRRGSQSLVRDGAAYCTGQVPNTAANGHPLWRFPRAGLLPSPVRFAHFARAGDSAVKLWEGEMLVPGR